MSESKVNTASVSTQLPALRKQLSMGPLPRKKSIRKKKVQFEKDNELPRSRSSESYLKHSAVKNMRDELKA